MATYNTHTLRNGLRIIHLPDASPVVYCGYAINAGTRDEQTDEEGLAHFCEHVTFKGTQRRRAWHILNRLESVGGDLNAFTTKEDTVYYAAILKEHLYRAVDLLSDIVFHSVYPQAELEKEAEVVCDEIESYHDSPSELIFDEFEKMLFAGHPLGRSILGKAQHLHAYTTADVLRFTTRHYRPDNMVFFACGNLSFPRLVRQLEKSTPATDSPVLPLPNGTHTAGSPMPVLPDYHPHTLCVEKGTHQAHVMIGNRAYHAYDERRMPLYLLNNILGGPGMNARLNLALRERHGLVYSVESSMVSYSDTGLWAVYFGCDSHDVNRCLRLIRRELDRFINNDLSTTQLAAAKKQLKGQLGVACDNRESFALDFGKSFLHRGWERDVNRLFRRIDAVGVSDIRKAACELFPQDRLTTLIFQ